MLAALSIHNLPEGILIYISTVTQQSLGVLVAIGLVFHKIPEGLVIAMPLYCLTKSKLKAFLISLASPVFLMTGSVIGWAVSNNLYVDNFANGALLAFAVGVLFWVSVAGLLPVSRKLDPQNKVCDISFLVGLAIVMISSSIFSYA